MLKEKVTAQSIFFLPSAIKSLHFFKLLTEVSAFNPLTPVPPITAHAETHPQFPVPPVTAREKACEDNCLSYPPWRDFGPPIVLLLLRTNKPMRMDFLSIFLEDSRGPRKTVFCLKITRSKSEGNSWRIAGQIHKLPESCFHSLNGQITSLAL